MKRFIVEQSNTEFFTSHSGFALVGLCLNRLTGFLAALRSKIPLRHGIAHSDLIKSYLGLLCLGKSDFEAIENFRSDRFFKASLGIDQVPSAARLRQRLDEHAKALLPLMYAAVVEFLVNAKVPVTPLRMGYVALDIDVFPRQIIPGPARKGFRGLIKAWTAMRRLLPTWGRRAGVWPVNCVRVGSIVRANFSTPWSGSYRMRAN